MTDRPSLVKDTLLGSRSGVRNMFILGGLAVTIVTLIRADPPVPHAVTMAWGVLLIITGLIPPRPPQRVNRIAACLTVIVSVVVMTYQALAMGEGVASAESAYVILFPLMFMVVVPDDPWVTGCSGLSSIVGVLAVLGPNSHMVDPDRVVTMCIIAIFTAIIALAGTFFHTREHAAELAQAIERNTQLEDIAVRERLVHQAERAAQIGRMVADVGHEINNPLTYVVASLELLDDRVRAEGIDDPDVIEALEDALDGTRRIELIVRDLKTAARDRDPSGRAEPNQAITAALRMATNELRHRTRVESDLGNVPKVPISEGRLTQIVVNLLINAAHAIPEGDHQANLVRITSSVTVEGAVRIEVTDTGTGMSPETLAKVFEPFYTTKEAGTGLGLPICKKFVEACGGSMTVDSTSGRGTTVIIELPAYVSGSSKDSIESDPALESQSARILIVDDEPLVGLSVMRLLSSHDVKVVASGAAALDLLSAPDASDYDIVLCDLMMPDISGMELFERIQTSAPELAQRFIFMTGGAFTDAGQHFIERVPNRVMEKPIRRAMLDDLILEWSQAKAEAAAEAEMANGTETGAEAEAAGSADDSGAS